METLEKKFLEKSGILPNVKESLKEIGFPADEDRVALITEHMERITSQFFEARHLETLERFFDTDTGKLWLANEVKFLQEVEKIVAAHIAYAKGDYMLRTLGLSNDSYSDDELDNLSDLQKN